MRIIICGSRDWTDVDMVREEMTALQSTYPNYTVIHGGAKGADRIAGQIAAELNLSCEVFRAEWQIYGKAAGAVRNKVMLDSGADLVVAFKEGFDPEMKKGGTENMVRIAIFAGVSTRVIPDGQRTKVKAPSE